MRAVRRTTEVVALGLSVLLLGGCASSGNQTESSSRATESEMSSSSGSDSSAEAEASSDSSEQSRKTVELASIIGTETTDGMPEGCPNAWKKLEGRDYDGTMYACQRFAARKQYREPTVTIGVDENIVRRVTLQAFYDSGDPVREVYRKVTDRYQQNCDSEGASGGAMGFRCDGYVAQVSRRTQTGALRVILGLKNWDLPN